MLGVHDLRMEQQREEPAIRMLPWPRPARWRSCRTTANPGGGAATKSPWLAQTRSAAGHVAKQRRRRRLQ